MVNLLQFYTEQCHRNSGTMAQWHSVPLCHSDVGTVCAFLLFSCLASFSWGESVLASSNVVEVIGSLCFGDLVQVDWLDASEATDVISHDRFDTPVCSVGFFLGLRGRHAKHLVIAKEIIDSRTYHYNVIPVGMVTRLVVHSRAALTTAAKRRLKKLYLRTFRRIKKREGWLDLCSEA